MKVHFIALLALIVLVSCNSNNANFNGTYQGKFAATDDAAATTEVNLKVTNDTAATIALYHYYNNTFLYTDLAESDSVTISGDTINVSFKLLGDAYSTFEAEQVDRNFMFSFVKGAEKTANENKLILLNPNNELINGAKLILAPVKAAKANFSMKYPEYTIMDDGMFLDFAYGRLKMKSIESDKAATREYDQNGILTGGGSLVVNQTKATDGTTTVTRRDKGDKHHVVGVFTYDKEHKLVGYSNSEEWKGEYIYDLRGRLVGYNGTAPEQWVKKSIFYDKRGAMIRQTYNKQDAHQEQCYAGFTLDDHNNNCNGYVYEYYK